MAKTLISTHDIAVLGASTTIDITTGIDNTYSVYEFIFVNMHPQNNEVNFSFQVNAYDHAGSSQLTGFNETITSTAFRAYQNEVSSPALGYNAAYDQAQGIAYQPLTYATGNDNDQACSGMLTLYDPSSTTFVKHFLSRTNDYQADDHTIDNFMAGYINTTNAITQISFKFSSGTIDAGTIYMYGVG